MTVEPAGTGHYHLLCYDADGDERRDGQARSDEVVRRLRDRPVTDVILLSHGWNGDVPAARHQYENWIGTMLACTADRAAVRRRRPGFEALVVGLHWPSLAWGDEEMPQPDAEVGDPVDRIVREYAGRLSDTPSARTAIRTIVEAGLDDIMPPTLPRAVRDAYATLSVEAGLPGHGPGAAPGDDSEPFDAEATYQAALIEEDVVTFGGVSGPGGLLAPLRTLTFWRMKRRARRFGETGAAELLRRLQAAVPEDRRVRFHLMGHSFGCIVVSAAVTGAPASTAVPVDSLSLVQGALSLWSYCSAIPGLPGRAGYFRRLVDDGLVAGPVVVTHSTHDRAVGSFYPLGAGLRRQVDFAPGGLPRYGGLGTFGARGPLPTVRDHEVGAAEFDYDLGPGVIHNIDCSSIIARGRGPSGAHSDICHPEIAHLVWSAIAAAP